MTGRRFAPLGVRPFGRLLTTYTVNEIGDAVGVVALAVLVYDRTEAVAPTAAIFIAAKFLPALIAPLLTARVDQLPLRRILPILYVLEAAAFAALGLIADSNFVLGLVARARARRRDARDHGARPYPRRRGSGAATRGAAARGQRDDERRLRHRLGRRCRARRPADRARSAWRPRSTSTPRRSS